MVEKIKLMADYECYPIWWVSSNKAGDINPETLPLSEKTISRLQKWTEVYDEKMNWEDPSASDFPSVEAKAAFEAEGISLWKQLQKELVPNYEVLYFSETLRKIVSDPTELESLLSVYA